MPPPPPRVGTSLGSSLTQFRTKEFIRAWNNSDNSWRWFIGGFKPVVVGLKLSQAKALFRDKAEITNKNLGMLTDLADIDVREFISPGDDRFASDRMPTEHLEIFVGAIIKLVSKGVTSGASKNRIKLLEQRLRSGLDMLRQHCIECRNEVRIPANSKMLTNFVNLDLNRWGAEVFDQATDFIAAHESPPALELFPEVVVPDWTRLSNFIGAGGLRNSQHQPRSQSSPPASRKGDPKRGYCYAWAKGECLRTARDCKWIHAHGGTGGSNGGTDPDDRSANGPGGGGRGNNDAGGNDGGGDDGSYRGNGSGNGGRGGGGSGRGGLSRA